jgi:hypothetical protein
VLRLRGGRIRARLVEQLQLRHVGAEEHDRHRRVFIDLVRDRDPHRLYTMWVK